MTRWKQLAPRLILVALVPMTLWVFANPLLRNCVVRRCQSITGAKVEIGSVRGDLLAGKLQISDLRIADPQNSMNNLLQLDTALLTFNPARLWHREFVVENGVVRNLRFDTSRSTSGFLSGTQLLPATAIQWFPREFDGEQTRLADQFASHLLVPEFASQIPSLELVRVSNEARAHLPATLNDQKVIAESVQNRLANLQSKLNGLRGNPLRDADQIQNFVEQLRSAEVDLSEANEDLRGLRDQIVATRKSLLDAKEADAKSICQRESNRHVDVQTLSKILVGPVQKDRIEEVLAWIRWCHSAILDPEKSYPAARGGGVDVQFLSRSRPTFLIRTLAVDGSGQFGGRSFQLAGTVKNLALPPRLLPDPCVVELQTLDGTSLVIRGELDRRSQEKVDHITLECSDLPMPLQTLGQDDNLSIDVSPSRLAARVDVRIHGEVIDGTVTLKQSNLTMRMRKTQSKLASADMIAALDRELRSLGEFSTEIRLEGKLENVQIEIATDLGAKLEPTIAKICKKQTEKATQDCLVNLDQLYQSELAQFNQKSQSQLDELAELLKSGTIRTAELDRIVPSSDGSLRIR